MTGEDLPREQHSISVKIFPFYHCEDEFDEDGDVPDDAVYKLVEVTEQDVAEIVKVIANQIAQGYTSGQGGLLCCDYSWDYDVVKEEEDDQ